MADTILAVLSLVWTGLLLGVSFLATPVKFLAPSLSLPVALDVGRQTFAWFSGIEIVVAVMLLATALVFFPRAWVARLAALLLATVAVQAGWLLPALDARVEILLQGGLPPDSMMHSVYIGLELVKLALLVAVASIALRGRFR